MSFVSAFSRYESAEEHALIELMVRRVNAGTVINIGAAALIGVVALFAPFWKGLVAIMALRLLIASISGVIGKDLARRAASGRPVLRTLNMLCASFFVGGTSWAGILMVVPIDQWMTIEALTLAVIISVGVTVVTIIASPVPRTMWAFYIGFVMMMSVQMLLHFQTLGPLPYVWGGVAALTSFLAVRISRDIRKTVGIDAENRRLAETLGTLNVELGDALDRADKLARFDQLTGVRNRRAFEEEAQAIAVRRDGESRWFAMIIDLDHFKRINDTHGHFVGDEYLRQVGAILANVEHLQDHGVAARLGGEEFVLLLIAPAQEDAEACAQEVRERVAALRIDGGTTVVETTTSIGLTEWRDKEPIHAALRRADVALYDAKRGGRDRVIVADGPARTGSVRAA